MSLEQIGHQLKAARDGAGLSLSQIHERTKIPFNHLEAIEQGSFDDLPEPVYVSGFIKRYADCVGLDGQQLAVTYRNALNSSTDKPEKSGFFFKTRKNNGASPPQTAYYNRKPIELAPPNLIKMIPFYALWIVVILALIIYLVNRQESADLAQQDPSILALRQSATRINNSVQQPNQPVAEKPNQTVTAEETNTTTNPSEQENQQTTPNDNQISLQAKKHVWVEVKSVSSGESLFTGFLEAGVSRTFSDKEGLRVRAGSGGNVSVTWAGKTQDLGPAGKIAEKAFINPVNKTAHAKTEPADNSTSTTSSIQSTSQASKKTTSIEKTVAAKKPIAVHKQHLANQAEHNANEGQGLTNKPIDVPYRY